MKNKKTTANSVLLKFWGFSGLASLLASFQFPAGDSDGFVNPQISEARCVSSNSEMNTEFQIEYVAQTKNDSYVIARLLSKKSNIEFLGNMFLGRIEIKNEITQPRALDSEGKPRFDLYIFRPKYKNQISEFKEGMILELNSGYEIQFLEPWHKTNVDLTIELKKEIPKGHILYGKDLITIGRRQDNDNVLFEVPNSSFKYALVHLTWKGKLEVLPFPSTITFKDEIDVYNNLILKDNNEWE